MLINYRFELSKLNNGLLLVQLQLLAITFDHFLPVLSARNFLIDLVTE